MVCTGAVDLVALLVEVEEGVCELLINVRGDAFMFAFQPVVFEQVVIALLLLLELVRFLLQSAE